MKTLCDVTKAFIGIGCFVFRFLQTLLSRRFSLCSSTSTNASLHLEVLPESVFWVDQSKIWIGQGQKRKTELGLEDPLVGGSEVSSFPILALLFSGG